MTNLLVSVNEQTGGTDAEHDVDTFGILRRVQIDTVHGELFRILKIV